MFSQTRHYPKVRPYDKTGMAGNRVNDFIEDLKGKKALTKQELRALGKRVDLIVDKTEGLIDDLNEKSEIVGKMLVKSIFGPKGELALGEYLGSRDG